LGPILSQSPDTPREYGEGGLWYDEEHERWEMTVEAGRDPVTGSRRRFKVRAATKPEVLRKVKEVRKQAELGVAPGAGSTTLAAFLDRWLKTVVAGRVGSENTIAMYRTTIKNHIEPALGYVRVDRLTPEMVDDLLAAKAAAGLSRSYVGRMRTILADALRHAERRGAVARNAGALAVMPRTKPPTPRKSLTAEEARRLLEAAKDEHLYALVLVGLTCGLRPGELTGLLWRDLDLDSSAPSLTVSGSMKRLPDSTMVRGEVKRSSAGQRTMRLSPSTVDAFRDHEAHQAAQRLAAGSRWVDNSLVFSSDIGTPLDLANLRKSFARAAKSAGVEGGFTYLLRHSAVSLLIDAGAGIEEVADLIGDDARTLYRHYRHRVRPVMDVGLRMDTVLRGEPV
jgi:integrase